ncbi:MAG: hypothetical protein M1838_005351 [Thelocarpon superellum]|nr:MAG: hypothetical protein M1838_005351 [Thelocarpon superellum]
MTTIPSPSTADQIRTHLAAQVHLRPNEAWLSTFLASQKKPTTPLSSLLATAKIRVLNADLTSAVDLGGPGAPGRPTGTLPPTIHDATLPERRLTGPPVPVQVLDVQDLTLSRWEQIEAIEAAMRGEGRKGREVVRVVPSADTRGEEGDRAAGGGGEGGENGVYKLLLQDAAGARVYAVELYHVKGVRILLRNARVARAVILLEPSSVTLLGGKIEYLHQAWVQNRKKALEAELPSRAEGEA